MTELACWIARIAANVIAVIIVQSLYSIWKEEEIITKRLHDLNMSSMQIPRDASLNSQYYQNNAYENSVDNLNSGLKRYNVKNFLLFAIIKIVYDS